MTYSDGRVNARRGLAALACAVMLAVSSQTFCAGPRSVAERLLRLEDTKEIPDLLIRYGLLRDYKGYAALFAKDGVWIGGFGTHRGPADIEAMLVQ
jgi:hypothetical protein